MARPFKSGVDYFPLDVNVDDKVKILEAEHDIIGFGIWVKLHQKVYASSYWIDWDKKAEIVFSKEINVDKNKVNEIINSCIEWEIFDKNVFETYSVLTSRGIQKRYFKICERRSRIEVVREYTLIDIPKVVNQEIVIVNINPVNECKSTQSKVKEIKVKEKEIVYPDPFIKLITDYPNTNGSKSQTFKNWKDTKKILSEDQIYLACMNSAKRQKQNSKTEPYYFQLSNLLSKRKYQGDLKELLKWVPNSNNQQTSFDSKTNGYVTGVEKE